MSQSSAEEQLILWSAATAARRESLRTRAERLAQRADWRRLTELLTLRRLLATLGPRIEELDPARDAGRLGAAVERALQAGRRHAAFLALISDRAVAALSDAGIASTAMKGPGLSETLYGDPGRRPSSDIDILLAAEQLAAAVDAIRGLGYAAPEDVVGSDGLPLLHFALTHERSALPPIELHWRIHWYERSWARERLLAPVGAPAGWRPEPIDELAALLLFYARDGFISVRHAADIAAWWDRFGERLAPGALDERIDAHRALGPVLAASARVAERVVGLPAARIVTGERRLGVRGEIAVRLAEPHPHASVAQLYADMGLIDGLLAPRDGLGAFMRRQLATPGDTHQLPASGERQHVAAVAARAATLLGRYAMALTRLLRPPRFVRSE